MKKAIEEYKYCGFYDKLIEIIDNAPTVEAEKILAKEARAIADMRGNNNG